MTLLVLSLLWLGIAFSWWELLVPAVILGSIGYKLSEEPTR